MTSKARGAFADIDPERLRNLPSIDGDKLRRGVEQAHAAVEGDLGEDYWKARKTNICIDGFGVFSLADHPLVRFIHGFHRVFTEETESLYAIIRWQAFENLLPSLDLRTDGGYMIPSAYFHAAGSCPVGTDGFDKELFLQIAGTYTGIHEEDPEDNESTI